ncbi:MAG: pseudouridine synthase [Desulfobacteraceae bacterium]|jgi:23S rRNA pseudouridine2605 synthase/23S rRNA pseudouridine2604 synthase
MPLLRLQKYLSDAGVCSRRAGENLIRKGRVSVNGETVTQLGTKIDPKLDRVAVDGATIGSVAKRIYIALNKPKGYVSSCKHPGEQVVVDLIDLPTRLFPIGRLDKESVGLLLLTNDGRLHHQLSHPGFDHEKEYEVSLQRPIDDADLKQMEMGIVLKGRRTRPAVVKRLSGRRFRIILKQGRNRQIRRMVRHLGHHVSRLKRIRMANIQLGKLPPGAWRYLTEAETKQLLKRLAD